MDLVDVRFKKYEVRCVADGSNVVIHDLIESGRGMPPFLLEIPEDCIPDLLYEYSDLL